MTIAQDKYFCIDTNPDGSQTLKAIVEFNDTDGSEIAIAFRFHDRSKTAVVSELPRFRYSRQAMVDIVPNLVWQRFLKPMELEPREIEWIHHEIYCDRVDVRHPYRGINPYDGKPENKYIPIAYKWNGHQFEHPNPGYLSGKMIWDKDRLQFFDTYFGTLEELTNRFNWQKGINRLGVDYTIQKINEDGSTILKTILFWEHPDYPTHSLVRIWCRNKTAIVIITEPLSNMPPEQGIHSYDVYNTNHVGRHLSQVIGEVCTKYSYLFSPYQADNIGWFLETDLAYSFEHERWNYDSSMSILKLGKGESGELLIQEIDVEDSQTESQTFLRSEPLGTAKSSFKELGWRNY
jgi:hypothetical protein